MATGSSCSATGCPTRPRVRGGAQAVRHAHARRARRRGPRAHVPLTADGDRRHGSGVPGHVPSPVVPERLKSRMTANRVSSFSKALALGEIHEDVVFPYPHPGRRGGGEGPRADPRLSRLRGAEHRLARDRRGRRGSPTRSIATSASSGSWGCTSTRSTAGQGLSQTGYARVFEAIGQVDGSLTIGMGVHQSIGLKGIAHLRDRRAEGALPARPGEPAASSPGSR